MFEFLSFVYGLALFAGDCGFIIWAVRGLLGRASAGGGLGLFLVLIFLKFFFLAGGLYLGLIGWALDPMWMVVGAFIALVLLVFGVVVRARREQKIRI